MTKQNGVIHTAEIYGGKVFLIKSKGILTKKNLLILQIQAYPLDLDGELIDTLKVRTFDLTECPEPAIELFLESIKDTDTLGSITFALTGGVIDGVAHEQKLIGAVRIR